MLLDYSAQRLAGLLLVLTLLLFLFCFLEFHAFLGSTHQLLAFKLLQLLDTVLVDGLNHEENLEALLLELLQEGGVFDSLLTLTSDVVNVLLSLLHPLDIVLQEDELVRMLCRVISQETRKLVTVGGVLVNTKLDVLGELFIESLVVLLVLGELLTEQLHALLYKVLTDDLQDLILLKHLTDQVEGKIFGIDNTLDEVEILRDNILTIVHNEDTLDVQLDIVQLLAGLEEIKRSTLRHKDDSLELKLTFQVEVLYTQMFLPIVSDTLVE